MTPAFVTPVVWAGGLVHPSYGALDTYQLAAEWLQGCATVADWGGGTGFFGTLLPPAVAYRVVDGTVQTTDQTLVNLAHFREPSDGILLRHVLDHNLDWRAILENALAACRRRLVVVTFTPDAPATTIAKHKSGWPILHFNPEDLRAVMGPAFVRDEAVQTTHPERIYYVERRR